MNEKSKITKPELRNIRAELKGMILLLDATYTSDPRVEPFGYVPPIPETVQECLDYLRQSIKYAVFDLEATRRECKFLQAIIQDDDDGEAQGAD